MPPGNPGPAIRPISETAPREPISETAPRETAAPAAKRTNRDPMSFSPQEIEILQSLAQRRYDLDKRAAEIDRHEALLQATEQRIDEKIARLQQMEGAWAQLLANEPVRALQTESENAVDLRSNLEQQISNAELEIADAADRVKQATAGDVVEIRKQEANARARLAQLRQQIETLTRQANDREKLLSVRLMDRERIEAERKAVQTQLTAVETQLREARGESCEPPQVRARARTSLLQGSVSHEDIRPSIEMSGPHPKIDRAPSVTQHLLDELPGEHAGDAINASVTTGGAISRRWYRRAPDVFRGLRHFRFGSNDDRAQPHAA